MATDYFSQNFSDNFRFVRSKKLVSPANDTYNIIRIPRFAFVSDVWLEKLTAYGDAGATMTIGFVGNGESADAVAFINNTLCNPDATGVINARSDTEAASKGKYFNTSSGYITVTVGDNSGSIGTFWIFATYSVLH